MLKKIVAPLVLGVASTLSLGTVSANDYILNTASTGGTYHPVGTAIATLSKIKLLPTEKFSLTAVNSAGSGANVQALAANTAQFAILQGLYGSYAATGTGPVTDKQENMRSISMLWQNVEQFILANELVSAGTASDLVGAQGKGMAMGKENSGTLGSNTVLLEGLGVDIASYDLVYAGYGPSVDAMANGQAVGAGMPSGPPTSAVTKLMSSNGDKFTILNVTEEEAAKMDGGRNLWVPYTIAAGPYPGQDADVTTIAQPNFLAVNADVDENHVYLLTKTIYENLPFLQGIHKATNAMDINKAMGGLPVPLHPASKPLAAVYQSAINEKNAMSGTDSTTDLESALPFKDRLVNLDYALTKPFPNLIFFAAICLFGLWHIATNVYLNEGGFWQNCIHFAGFALLATITTSKVGPDSHRLTFWLNVLFGLLIAFSALWIAYAENGIYARTLAKTGLSWQFTAVDWFAGIMVIVGAIELTRRLTGWIIPILVLLALSYNLFLGEMMPGAFRAASLPLNDVLFRSLYNDEGMFGVITTISSANITLFMIFGAFLVVSGASDFVIEVSKSIAGRYRGGAALVAVMSSAMTGTISGSAVANTASTGIITIPLMKSNGFRGKFAAGVEAAASTGGQLMPPIMGSGAFVMASYTGIPYSTIVAVSVVPALLYFLSVGFIVRIEAIKYGIGTEQAKVVDRKKLLAGALNFVLPLCVMTTLLVTGKTPSYAAAIAIGTLIVVSWLTPNKMGPKNISRALALGVSTSIMTAVLLVAVGLINNAVTTSGLANTFALMIAQWSQGSLWLALILIAVTSLVLGMGLPVTAAYIVLSILSAPALAGMLADGLIVQQLVAGISDPAAAAMFMLVDSPLVEKVATGMSLPEARQLMSSIPFELAVVLRPALIDVNAMTTFLLTAHLIVFWLSQDSNVTPPVCLAAFTAAGIAKSPPMATGVEAWKIAKGLYIVPILFAYTPLIGGDFLTVARIGFFSLFGIYAFSSLLQRYSEGPLKWWMYVALLLGGLAAFYPLSWLANIVGASIVVLTIVLSGRGARKVSQDHQPDAL